MSELIQGPMMALLADLEQAVTEIIDRHFAVDEKRTSRVLVRYGPIGVYVTNEDGVVASFMEDGIEIYPNVTIKEN